MPRSMTEQILDEFSAPTHCYWCGAFLMGGATRHKQTCPILADIKQMFPNAPSYPEEPAT